MVLTALTVTSGLVKLTVRRVRFSLSSSKRAASLAMSMVSGRRALTRLIMGGRSPVTKARNRRPSSIKRACSGRMPRGTGVVSKRRERRSAMRLWNWSTVSLAP